MITIKVENGEFTSDQVFSKELFELYGDFIVEVDCGSGPYKKLDDLAGLTQDYINSFMPERDVIRCIPNCIEMVNGEYVKKTQFQVQR